MKISRLILFSFFFLSDWVASLFSVAQQGVEPGKSNLGDEKQHAHITQGRRRLKVEGSETFVGIRVVATGCDPTPCSVPPTVAQIADDLYGDTNNLVSVANDCSYGAFTVGPAADINGNVLATAGVYEVTITENVFNMSVSDTRDIVKEQLRDELGDNFEDGADKFIYFFPPELWWGVLVNGGVPAGWGGGNSKFRVMLAFVCILRTPLFRSVLTIS